jgi:hypothetical protein
MAEERFATRNDPWVLRLSVSLGQKDQSPDRPLVSFACLPNSLSNSIAMPRVSGFAGLVGSTSCPFTWHFQSTWNLGVLRWFGLAAKTRGCQPDKERHARSQQNPYARCDRVKVLEQSIMHVGKRCPRGCRKGRQFLRNSAKRAHQREAAQVQRPSAKRGEQGN